MEGLHFDQVKAAPIIPKDLVDVMAVLQVHEKTPKDEQGVSTVMTIRKLIELYAPGVVGLLREYICAFGKHGQAVVAKYCQQLEVDQQQFEQKVSKRVAEIETDLKRRGKE